MTSTPPPADRADRGPASWKYPSPAEPGFHPVITPDNSSCQVIRMSRLNLQAGQRHRLDDAAREMVAGVVTGSLEVRTGSKTSCLGKLDAFYVPGGKPVEVAALTDTVLYIGAAPYEGVGAYFVQRYDPTLPLGEIHQIHGKGTYEREVFMTLNPERPASRLIAGWTFGRPGGWTSWPPHQHEDHLEEVYAYFDMPAPAFGLHLSYREPGRPEAVHAVSSGDFVAAPRGYHPTVAMPGVRNTYFWVLAAHRLASRRYDLAISDPVLSALNFGRSESSQP
jgi:5-deoxy-glucuronate isomerase